MNFPKISNIPYKPYKRFEEPHTDFKQRYPMIYSIFADDINYHAIPCKIPEQHDEIPIETVMVNEEKPISTGFSYNLGSTIDSTSGFKFAVPISSTAFATKLRLNNLLREDICNLLMKRKNLVDFKRPKRSLKKSLKIVNKPAQEKPRFNSNRESSYKNDDQNNDQSDQKNAKSFENMPNDHSYNDNNSQPRKQNSNKQFNANGKKPNQKSQSNQLQKSNNQQNQQQNPVPQQNQQQNTASQQNQQQNTASQQNQQQNPTNQQNQQQNPTNQQNHQQNPMQGQQQSSGQQNFQNGPPPQGQIPPQQKQNPNSQNSQ